MYGWSLCRNVRCVICMQRNVLVIASQPCDKTMVDYTHVALCLLAGTRVIRQQSRQLCRRWVVRASCSKPFSGVFIVMCVEGYSTFFFFYTLPSGVFVELYTLPSGCNTCLVLVWIVSVWIILVILVVVVCGGCDDAGSEGSSSIWNKNIIKIISIIMNIIISIINSKINSNGNSNNKCYTQTLELINSSRPVHLNSMW